MKPVANFAICVILCCSKLVASVPFPEDLARYLAAAYGTSALTGLQQQLQTQQIAFNPNQDQLNNIQNQFKTSQSYPSLQNGDVSSGVLLGPIQNQNAGSIQENFLGQSQVPIFQQQRLPQQPLNIPLQQQNYQQVNEPFINRISEIRNAYDGSGGAVAASQAYIQPENIIRSIQQIQRNPNLNTQNIDKKILLQNDQPTNRQPQNNIPIVHAPSIQQTIKQPLLNDNIQTLNVPQSLQDPRIQKVISGTKFNKRFLVIHPDGTIDHVDSLESVIKQNPNYVLLNSARITEPIHTEEQHPATVQENNIRPHAQTIPQIHQNHKQFRVTEVTAKKEDPVKRHKVEENINKPVHNNSKTEKSNIPTYRVPNIKTILLNNNVQKIPNKLNNTKVHNPVHKVTKNITKPSEQNHIKKLSPTNKVQATSAATSPVSSSKISEQVKSNPKNIKNEKAKPIPKVTETPVPTKIITPSSHVEVKKDNPKQNKMKVNKTSNGFETQSIKKPLKEGHITKLNHDLSTVNKTNESKNEKKEHVKANITSDDSTKVNKSLNIVPISSSKSNSTMNPNKNIKSTTILPNQNNANNNTDTPHVRRELVNKSKPKTITNKPIKKPSIKEDKKISYHRQNNNNKKDVKEKSDSKNPSAKKHKDLKNTQHITKSENKDLNDEGKQKMLDIIKTLAHSEYKDKVVVLQIVMPPIVDREVHTTVYPNGTIVDEITELIWDEENEDAVPVEVKTINVRNINDDEE